MLYLKDLKILLLLFLTKFLAIFLFWHNFMGKMIIIITLIWFQRTKYLHDWNQFMKSHTFHHDLRAWVTFSNRLLNRPLIGLLGHFLIKRTKDLKQINTIFQSYITICKVSPPCSHLCPLFSTSSVLWSNKFWHLRWLSCHLLIWSHLIIISPMYIYYTLGYISHISPTTL